VGAAILLPNIIYEGRNISSTTQMAIVRLLLGVVGLILMPLTIVCGLIAAIVPGTCIVTIHAVKMVRKRIIAKKTRKQLIKSREERLRKNEQNDVIIDLGNASVRSQSPLNRPLLGDERYLSQLQGDLSIDIE